MSSPHKSKMWTSTFTITVSKKVSVKIQINQINIQPGMKNIHQGINSMLLFSYLLISDLTSEKFLLGWTS